MQRMLEHFQCLLTAIVAHPDEKLANLSLLSEAEREKLLVEWNDTAAQFSNGTCVHELFEAQVARTPDAVAAEFQGKQLTYRELNARANQLAHYLGKQGVGPEVLVGVCVERSFEMLVSILAVLKAGAAYVPLDPTYPSERIAFMIEDAGLSLLLTQARVATRLPRTPRRYDDSPLPLGEGLGERVCDAVSPHPNPPPKGEGNKTSLVLLDQDWEIISRENEQNPAIE